MSVGNNAFDRIPSRRRPTVPTRDTSYLPNAPSNEKMTPADDIPVVESSPRTPASPVTTRDDELMTVTIRVTKGLNKHTKVYFQSEERGNFSTFVQAVYELFCQTDTLEPSAAKLREHILEQSSKIADKRTQDGKRKRVITMYENEMKN